MIAACANEEDDDFAVGGFVAVVAGFVGDGGAEFLGDDAVHVDVSFPADGHEIGVQGFVAEDEDRWEKR